MAANQSILTDRTPKEIVSRILDIKGLAPIQNFPEALQLLKFLDYEDAKPFLGGAATQGDWEVIVQGLTTPGNLVRQNLRKMWATANEMLSVPTDINIAGIRAWLWLDLKDEILKIEKNVQDMAFGKPLFYKTAKAYDLNWRRMDNDTWFINGYVKTADQAIARLFGEEELQKANEA